MTELYLKEVLEQLANEEPNFTAPIYKILELVEQSESEDLSVDACVNYLISSFE